MVHGITALVAQPDLGFRRQVDDELGAFLDSRRDRWIESGTRPCFSVLRSYVLSPGKRLRPTFCYWGWRGAGGEPGPQIIRAAASIELFHSFCLIHDDIMDTSDMRRGQPALHRQFADIHARSGWRGDATRFGVNAAIVAGDLLAMWSDEMLQTCGLDPAGLRAAYPYVARMRADVCVGQFLDAEEQAHGGSLSGAVLVARYKTAGYTVQGPLQIGAALAGAPQAVLTALGAIGRPLGEAFQFRDDLLGAFGDPKVTGKSDMDDFREGKPTALVALARDGATAHQARQISALHGNPRLTVEGAALLRRIIVETGARKALEAMIDERVEQARQALAAAPLSDPAVRGELELLLTSTAHRES
ncbi:polyprenyl synthetase family protein [Catenulispora sp. NF23]|uniref:Polyprenyl synthetase family protein n=1 Tax=Catenulispora pinistramenti TaxID=2705254 RepID=A0ABS5KKS4_9ACTN|nr:polyprenyl synthetase family protein [Catenulispora pinistramenti]MBS2531175.1 polyprenyl synthetase family protein [Catenulispora pinistramenti]MBS2546632.1 polyprenyl synthetase family protein [Catenulispora pinistramenti]